MKLHLLKNYCCFLTLLLSVICINLNAQVSEKFEYAPGNLHTANGGTGWSAPWNVSKGINIEAGDLGPMPGTPTGKVRFVDSDPLAFRSLSKTYTDEAGKIYWIEFSMQGAKKAPNVGQTGNNDSLSIDWSGISLFNDNDENGFMGKSDNFGVGFGDAATINNALYGANHYLVKLVMSGDNNKEMAYMWLNYTGSTEPNIASANLSAEFGVNGRLSNFNRIRLAGAGAWGTTPDISIDNIIISELFNGASVPVESVSVSPATASIAIGFTEQLNATIMPADASNISVTWSSSNTDVATVNSSGLVTGVSAGTATITATTADGSKTSTAEITITAANVPVTVTEKFEYSAGNLNNTNGGNGWSGPWSVSRGISIQAGDLGTIQGTPSGKVRFVESDPLGFRNLIKTYSDEAGKVYWIEFSIQGAKKAPNFGQTGNNDSISIDWSGISLFDGGNENGFMGKPGAGGQFGVGFSDDAFIDNALYGANHYLVKLVMSGDNAKETAYMWVNYTGTTEPGQASANLTGAFGADGRSGQFNRIRFAGAGAWGTTPDIAIDNFSISETFQTLVTLPLKLISFNVVASSAGNTLSWVTSAEVNMKNFVIERIEKDGTYQSLTTVSALSNLNGAAYKAYDTKPLPGINYYRLKMIDIDGTFSYSPIVKIATPRISNAVSIYPNPTKNGMLTIVAGTEAIKSVSLINISGIRVLNIAVQPGNNLVPVNVKSLAKGVYIVEIISAQSSIKKQVIIE